MHLKKTAVALLVVLASSVLAITASASPGLQVDVQGRLIKDGRPYRGIGVNYFNCFHRVLKDRSDTSYREGFRTLAQNKIPFVRFMACGFWPLDWKLYHEDKEAYYKLLDDVVKSAEETHIGLIPSLFWYYPAISDVVGEPVNQWGNPKSKTIWFMRNYVREVVTRYNNSPAIWGWEFGNEMNLSADLPNASEHRPWCFPELGTPAVRTEKDEYGHGVLRKTLAEFAKEVRKYDKNRIVITGNSFPRPSAMHQMIEKSWNLDSRDQFEEVLLADNPSPVDTVCVHFYVSEADRFGEKVSFYDLLALTAKIGRKAKKPLFVGEFGITSEADPEQSKDTFYKMLSAIQQAGVPLAALWVFDMRDQSDTYSVTASNNRCYQLRALKKANEGFASSLTNKH